MIVFKRAEYGFSLIELLVVLLLVSIILLLSVEGVSSFFQHRKQRLLMQQLYHDLKWTRIEAIALDMPVAIQPYNSLNHRVTDNWCHGWAVFKNPEKQGFTQSSQLLKVHAGSPDCGITFSSFPELPYFQFLPEGISDYQNGTFRFYDQSQVTMEIVVNQAGRVRWDS